MPIIELTVLWVDCMKLVGFIGASLTPVRDISKASVFSTLPRKVPVMMASGCSIPASRSAVSEVASERFMSLPMRRASIGVMNCL